MESKLFSDIIHIGFNPLTSLGCYRHIDIRFEVDCELRLRFRRPINYQSV